jgi:predicted DNA-binding antitoxin AbrB/MazE fold protein
MSRSVQAIYEKGVLRPLEPVNLHENEQVTLTIDEGTRASLGQVHFTFAPEQWQACIEALDAPPKDIPALRKLLTEASLFDGN